MPNNWVHTFLLILPFLHGRRSNDLSPNLCVRLNFQFLHTKMFEEFSRNGLLFSFFDFCNKIGLFFHDCCKSVGKIKIAKFASNKDKRAIKYYEAHWNKWEMIYINFSLDRCRSFWPNFAFQTFSLKSFWTGGVAL